MAIVSTILVQMVTHFIIVCRMSLAINISGWQTPFLESIPCFNIASPPLQSGNVIRLVMVLFFVRWCIGRAWYHSTTCERLPFLTLKITIWHPEDATGKRMISFTN